jgi:hypothetical protein
LWKLHEMRKWSWENTTRATRIIEITRIISLTLLQSSIDVAVDDDERGSTINNHTLVVDVPPCLEQETKTKEDYRKKGRCCICLPWPQSESDVVDTDVVDIDRKPDILVDRCPQNGRLNRVTKE